MSINTPPDPLLSQGFKLREYLANDSVKIYERQHGMLWRAGRALLAFGAVFLIPFIGSKYKALWKEATTGIELKTVKVAQDAFGIVQGKPVNAEQAPKGILKGTREERPETPRRVGFGEERVRHFDNTRAAADVGMIASIQTNLQREQTPRVPSPAAETAATTPSLFAEGDIIHKAPIFREENGVRYTSNNKAILLQKDQSPHSGAAAVVSMLALDHDKKPTGNEGSAPTVEGLVSDLQSLGLSATSQSYRGLKQLRFDIIRNGSAILQHEGRYVIVDTITPRFDELRLRDPYVGMEMTVRAEAARLSGPVIQVPSNQG